ncbi:hypothetical protein E1286_17125 [Nonomuraea terrae]|uniref:DUF3558 domain-containing protein n=1 Tax=Nonomuraea terrae TaxID=2530383 RepID=A0A4R4YTA1_9ACTN|nr:hypothetical protein [Nonomuraea terrae]TDD47644.1 hypothetical protein E1286_17125 [Nonomuraea terrae]
MRRPAVMLVMCVLALLTACGGGHATPRPEVTWAAHTPDVTREGVTLSCDGSEVRLPAISGLEEAGSFARLDSLRRPLEVEGRIWKENDERVYVGVVCGVRRAEEFATLVARSRLTVYEGKPALRWVTRTGVRNFMWLERPGTAVYIGATPGLATEVRPIANDITSG